MQSVETIKPAFHIPGYRNQAATYQAMLERIGAPKYKFRKFVSSAWSILEPSTPFVPGYHIEAICEHLEAVTLDQIRHLIINIPPRCMKSLLVAVLWPAWEWTGFPGEKYICSSYAQQLALRDSVKCRTLIESPWYQARWGDRVRLAGDQNEKKKFQNTAQGFRMATSVGAVRTGEAVS